MNMGCEAEDGDCEAKAGVVKRGVRCFFHKNCRGTVKEAGQGDTGEDNRHIGAHQDKTAAFLQEAHRLPILPHTRRRLADNR